MPTGNIVNFWRLAEKPKQLPAQKSSVIRLKGKSQQGGNKKTKRAKFSEKHSYSLKHKVCVSGGKKCLFFRSFAILPNKCSAK